MFFYIVLTPISTTSGLWSTGNTRKYHQIDVYIYQCGYAVQGLRIQWQYEQKYSKVRITFWYGLHEAFSVSTIGNVHTWYVLLFINP